MEVLVFGGTVEGRKLAEWLSSLDACDVVTCTATEYGGELVDGLARVTSLVGPLDAQAKERLVSEHDFACIVDATHPYATHVTESIAALAVAHGLPRLRLVRDEAADGSFTLVEDVAGAASAVAGRAGNVMLTTGAKDLATFVNAMPDFAERLYARILPVESSVAKARELGIPASHIIAMQGPFSTEMNVALIRQFDIRTMVTKASGATGGFQEKIDAAAACGAELVVIQRPDEEAGLSFAEVQVELAKMLGVDSEVICSTLGQTVAKSIPACHSERSEESSQSGYLGKPLRGDPSPSAQDDSGVGQDDSGVTRDGSIAARGDGMAARDDSGVTRDDSIAARDGGAAARDGSVAARDDGAAARDGSVAARDDGAAARDGSIAARDDGAAAWDGSVAARDDEFERRTVYLVGIGLGDPDTRTVEAVKAIERSELLIGAARMLEPYADKPCQKLALIRSDDIVEALRASEAPVASVLFSGDVGFYSGATALSQKLRDVEGLAVRAVPGISSVVCLCARLLTPWQDVHLVSAHGRECDPVAEVRTHAKTFMLTGGKTKARDVCEMLVKADMGTVLVHVGERLSYPDERIVSGTAAELAQQEFLDLAVMLVENPAVPKHEPGKLEA